METIKFRHILSIGVLFSIGNFIIYLGNNNLFVWQTLIIAFILSIIILFLYQKLLYKYPNNNLFEIIKNKYNNIFGNILIILYLVFLLYNLSSAVFSFVDFISTVNQSDFVSKEIIMLLHFILICYVLKNSLITLGKFSQVIFVITLSMILILYILGIKDINFLNNFPITFPNFLINHNTLDYLIQPFLETTILFNVICKMKQTKIKNYIFIIINLFSLLILLIISTEIVGLLGKNYTSYLNYPYYTSISCINMSKIVIKIESLSLLIVYFTGFIKFVFVAYSFLLGINTIFKYQKLAFTPLILMINIFGMVIFNNVKEMNIVKYYYNIYALIIITMLPILLIRNNIKVVLKKK